MEMINEPDEFKPGTVFMMIAFEPDSFVDDDGNEIDVEDKITIKSAGGLIENQYKEYLGRALIRSKTYNLGVRQ